MSPYEARGVPVRTKVILVPGLQHLLEFSHFEDSSNYVSVQEVIVDGDFGLPVAVIEPRAGTPAVGEIHSGATEARGFEPFSAIEPKMRIFDANFIVPSVLVDDLLSRDGLARAAIARGDLDDTIARSRRSPNLFNH